jgi:prolyl-tRNA synthetase
MNKGQNRPQQITPQSKNFSKWYNDTVLQAGLADYAPVKGCMVIKPYGYSIWEKVQEELGNSIKKAGVENAYFPLFIPKSFLEKEKEHVAGFSPETAVVTFGGGKKLEEPLIVRPTSETIIYYMYSRWISSWRDLPLKINQWANVVRWEKRTYLFLRTTEFLWQEGHTAHATKEEARKEARRALTMYRDFYRQFFAIEPIVGVKSSQEKFAGAQKTYTVEVMTKNGRALQAATSHELGQKFAKAFNITFQDKNKKTKYVWQTSWGLSTRAIGGLIMAHGDDRGLVLPPKVAPVQIVIIPIFKKGRNQIEKYTDQVLPLLKNFRVKVDQREQFSPGWKFNEWEVKGVPIRIEIGENEVKNKTLTLSRRDQPGRRETIKLEKADQAIKTLLEQIQKDMYQKHQKLVKANTSTVDNFASLKKAISERKFASAFWCENPECEDKIKEETKATSRCLPLDAPKQKGRCIVCGQPASYRWIFAKAY